MWKYRVGAINTETGGQLQINYSAPDCMWGSNMPSDADWNLKRLGWRTWLVDYDEPAVHGPAVQRRAQGVRLPEPARLGPDNRAQLPAMVHLLGQYGPVMVGQYGGDDVDASVFDRDMRTLLTDESITELT